jgi:GR25 family glycosyltransferase involved in LPS biosynthesis
MLKELNTLPVYAIVVKDNEASEFYFEKIKPVWKSIGIDINRFDATTPSTLPNGPLTFDMMKTSKYTGFTNGVGKAFTETEKAVWYSHYRLWRKCVEQNQRLVVIEHDCVPFAPNKLWYNDSIDFKSFDLGALGCYMISPQFAHLISVRTAKQKITTGPLGAISSIVYHNENRKQPFKWNYIDASDKRWDPGCTQIIHTKFGTTIEHYAGTVAEGVKGVDKPWPYYVVIDNLPDPLDVDIINANKILSRNLLPRS